MCGGYLAAVVFGTYGMVWQNTVRSKEDLNPKGVVLLGFLQQQMAKLYIVLVKNIWLWRFM